MAKPTTIERVRWLALSLVAVLTLAAAGLAPLPAAAACGDVNDDGAFDSSDLDDTLAFLADPVANPLSPQGLAQCTVTGRARACDVRNAVVMERALAGVATLGTGCEDGDQDGVLDDADACPESPDDVAPMVTPAGCTVLDVVLRPESLTMPADLGLAEGAKILSSPSSPAIPRSSTCATPHSSEPPRWTPPSPT